MSVVDPRVSRGVPGVAAIEPANDREAGGWAETAVDAELHPSIARCRERITRRDRIAGFITQR